jgi:gliding motility-associated-like protein
MKKLFLTIGTILFFVLPSKASHIFGGEFTYEYISGNTYRFNLTLYADCAGSSTLLSNLYNALPIIERYNNNVSIDTFTLALIPGSGVEVSPVCLAQLSNTACATPAGTLTGVRQFKYTGTKNLGSTSANWKFLFWGELNILNNYTGRSNNITNIDQSICGGTGGSSIMAFEATLNNLNAPNNTVNYTTIPTPFHCINKPQSFNHGAVDPDGDILSFDLVDGIDGNANSSVSSYCYVSYLPTYSAIDPLKYVAGTFNFSTATGQLNYTPNQVQRSLVVVKVTETRNGVVVGTTMREMTFVVLPNCNNNPPGGNIGSVNVGYIDSFTNIYFCQNTSNLNFSIPVTDLDGDSINVTYSGLPAGCTLSVTGNNTSSPLISGIYAPSGGYVLGNYTLYVSYQDYGCPLVSKQTIAYTIHVLPTPNLVTTVTQPTCANGGVGAILGTASGGTPNSGGTVTYTLSPNNINNTIGSFTNLAFGNYTIVAADSKGCSTSASFSITQANPLVINSFTTSNVLCNAASTGNIQIAASGGSGTINYTLQPSSTNNTTGIFNALSANTYTAVATDGNGCTITTSTTITQPSPISFTTANASPALCSSTPTGTVNVTASGGVGSFVYTLLNNSASNTTGSFTNLGATIYTVQATDGNGCAITTTLTVTQSTALAITNPVGTIPTCYNGNNGQIAFTANGGTGAIAYAINGGTSQSLGTFVGLVGNATYTLSITDANNCLATSTFFLNQPPALQFTSVIANSAQCWNTADGSITAVGNGGTGTITYSLYPLSANNTNGVFNNLFGSIYTVTITDANGCSQTSSTIVGQPLALNFISITTTPVICAGTSTGTLTALATGGFGSYTYTIVNTSASNKSGSFSNLAAGIYTIKVVDTVGCILDTTFSVNTPQKLLLDIDSFQSVICPGVKDATIYARASFGNPGGYSYVLLPVNFVNTTGTFKGVPQGTFTVLAVDALGCSNSATITIAGSTDTVHVDFTITPISCVGYATDGKIEAIPSGGHSPYLYSWNNGTDSNKVLDSVSYGYYIVNVVDRYGCTATDTAYMPPSNCCEVFIPNAFTPNQDGLNDKLIPKTSASITIINYDVFDRFGNKVFGTVVNGEGWDGTYKKQKLDMNTYFYIFNYRCLHDDKTYLLKGDVLLVR